MKEGVGGLPAAKMDWCLVWMVWGRGGERGGEGVDASLGKSRVLGITGSVV